MSRFSKVFSAASLFILTTSTLAGGAMTGPTTTGIFAGIGGSYSSLTTPHTSLSLQGGLAGSTDINSFVSSANGAAPFAQIGYWGHWEDNVLWGAKAFYKYLDLSTHYTGFAPAGAGGIALGAIDTYVEEESGALLMAGIHFQHLTAYLGGGFVYMPIRDTLQSSSEGSLYTARGDAMGGIVELGLRYDITPSWFADLDYSYTITADQTFRTFAAVSQTYIRTIQITVQQVDLSLNYLFSV